MNIRKRVNYTDMFATISKAVEGTMLQVELYYEIGRVVSARPEKGAAVAAAEFLTATYPNIAGFSPRNLRRMRDFYRNYDNNPALLELAMEIGWTQNLVIMEAELTMEERVWYMKATRCHGWSKSELTKAISDDSYTINHLDANNDMCYTDCEEYVFGEFQAEPEGMFSSAIYTAGRHPWEPTRMQ